MANERFIIIRGQGLLSLFNDYKHPEREMEAWRKYVDKKKDGPDLSANGADDLVDMIRPRVQRSPGKLRGLSFMVKFDEDVESMSCPIADSQGYVVMNSINRFHFSALQ